MQKELEAELTLERRLDAAPTSAESTTSDPEGIERTPAQSPAIASRHVREVAEEEAPDGARDDRWRAPFPERVERAPSPCGRVSVGFDFRFDDAHLEHEERECGAVAVVEAALARRGQ
jgi:hypothetical protein